MSLHPRAGKPAQPADLIDVRKLVIAYSAERPDPSVAAQRVAFGTSGHRGCSWEASFNEWHILAMTQAICDYRRGQRIDGPMFVGIDTHALSEPALASTVEVLAANDITVVLPSSCVYTPTPVIAHAILSHNRGRSTGLADGIVITPSHNPPQDGGFKYNPTHGGPAGKEITSTIEAAANQFLENSLGGVRRMSHGAALRAPTTERRDLREAYVADLGSVLDFDIIRDAGLTLGADPLGGGGGGVLEPDCGAVPAELADCE